MNPDVPETVRPGEADPRDDPGTTARESAFDQAPPHDLAEEHRVLRTHARDLCGSLDRLMADRHDSKAQLDLLGRLRPFAAQIGKHFAFEEASCAMNGASTPNRRWIECLAAEHMELHGRIRAVLATLEDAFATRSAVPESIGSALTSFLDDLVQHELTEARLFQMSVLGH